MISFTLLEYILKDARINPFVMAELFDGNTYVIPCHIIDELREELK